MPKRKPKYWKAYQPENRIFTGLQIKDDEDRIGYSYSLLRRCAAQHSFLYEVPGFDDHWTWDDPPTFGRVNNGDMTIFFCKGDQGHKGTWLALNVDNVDEFYEMIKDKEVEISGPPETKPWSMREMLVKDPDGHILRVGHNTQYD